MSMHAHTHITYLYTVDIITGISFLSIFCVYFFIDLILQTQFCFIFLFSVYDVSGAASDRNVVVLNDIHIDIMDYIVPATCTDTEFRQMWAEFEWENKVRDCLSVLTITLFKCLSMNVFTLTIFYRSF